jgi:uncharacterized caspase-like protein
MEQQIRNKWAILIGINDYQHVKSLKYCTNDIKELNQAFQQFLEFPSDHILEISDFAEYKPTRSTIYHEVGKIFQQGTIQPDDIVVFYFTGHGMIDSNDRKDYLLPSDATPYNLKFTGIQVDDLVVQLKSTKCNNLIMFIDACREAIEGQKGVISIGEDSKSAVQRAGIVTFFSCDPRDLSYEIEQLQHGTFTHCIVEAIKDKYCNSTGDIDEFLRSNVPTINRKYNKPVQLPYTIIEPAEMKKLQLFSSKVQLQVTKNRLDNLLNKLGDLFAGDKLDVWSYSKSVDIIDKAKDNSGDELMNKKLKWIEQLCEGELSKNAFRVALEAIERQKPKGPSRKVQLGKLR